MSSKRERARGEKISFQDIFSFSLVREELESTILVFRATQRCKDEHYRSLSRVSVRKKYLHT